jgi:glycosyltransferase involved in cell wall biosynthesis
VSVISGGRLDPDRFDVQLAHGELAPGEGSMTHLVEREGARVHFIPALGPSIDPRRDLRALLALARVMRRFRPHIVHTHTAKAGFVGRLAAVLALRPRPALVHTYHGHVLEGYFGPAQTGAYRFLESAMARVTDQLVGVSRATVDDLLRLGVGRPDQYRVIPIGLDLEPFASLDPAEAGTAELRRELGFGPEDVTIAFAGRLAPIKRVDLLLRAAAGARSGGVPLRTIVVGDGEERPGLESLAAELGISESVSFLGYQRDLVPVTDAMDIAVLGSDNEGTPMSLIEAGAAARPAVATAVGGVSEVVTPDSGMLVPPGDGDGFTEALVRVGTSPGLRESMGGRAREHVLPRYSAARLVADTQDLYEELVGARISRASGEDARSPVVNR